MRKRKCIKSALIYCFIFLTLLNTSCYHRTISRIHGKRIAVCKGKIDLNNRGETRFQFEVFNVGDSFQFFFRTGYLSRFRLVEDLSFNDGKLRVEVGSPHRVYEGSLLLDSLSVEGEWDQFKGLLQIGSKN